MKVTYRGFTLIELLVVIAIIGVLSSIVLSSLNTARLKAADASIKASLSSARGQAELFYDANNNQYVINIGSTDDVCSPTGNVGGIKGVYTSIMSAANASGLSTVNTSILVSGTASTATCHSCRQSGGGCTGSYPITWAAEVPLKASAFMYCVDSTGFIGTTSGSTLAASDPRCN